LYEKKKVNLVNKSTNLHHIFPNSKNIEENSILLSYGLDDENDNLMIKIWENCGEKKDYFNLSKLKLLCVRGKLTRSLLEKQLNCKINENYFEPLIFLKELDLNNNKLIQELLNEENSKTKNYETAIVRLIYNKTVEFDIESKGLFKIRDFYSGFGKEIDKDNNKNDKYIKLILSKEDIEKKIEEFKVFPLLFNLFI
jgi:hypothetical protein